MKECKTNKEATIKKKVALKQIWLVGYLIKCVGSTWRFLIHGAHGPNAHSYKLCMSDVMMM